MTASPPLTAWHSGRQLRRTGSGDRSGPGAPRAVPWRPETAGRRSERCVRPRCRFAAGRSPARPTRMQCRSHRPGLGTWARPWPARRSSRVRGASPARQSVPALRASWARRLVPARQASCARQLLAAQPACESHSPLQAPGGWLFRQRPALATARTPLRAASVQVRQAVSPPPSLRGVRPQPSRREVRQQPSRPPGQAWHLPVHEAEQALPLRRRASAAPAADRPRRGLPPPARRAARAATLPSGSPARPPAVTRRKLQRRAAADSASPSGRDTRARRHHATPQARAATRRSMHRRPAAPESPARAEPSCRHDARAPEASRPGPKPVPRAHWRRSTAPPRPLPRRPGAAACGRNAGSTGRCPG
jgi:hypothetical protein